MLPIIVLGMQSTYKDYRYVASTGIHRGDRPYQQDQVRILAHQRFPGCLMGIVADGMGGKSGGRKASDQVVLIAAQLFDRYSPEHDSPTDLLKQLIQESHITIKLTAITSEEEPHSTLAAFLIQPNRECHVIHAGDSRVYHYRGNQLQWRTLDHSYVQRLIDEGQITEAEANKHPNSNLLTGCLGSQQDPPITLHKIDSIEEGDTIMACSDGLWHYFTAAEMGRLLHSHEPGESCAELISQARLRAKRGGDNISLAVVKLEGIN